MLFGQVRLAQYLEAQVDSTFFVFRGVGYATYFLQGDEAQVALAIAELPEGSLRHSERVAITMLVIGGWILATIPFVRRRRGRRR